VVFFLSVSNSMRFFPCKTGKTRKMPCYGVSGALFGANAMLIGDLGRRTGTRVETIRFYEREGLIPAPARTSGNYRVYGEAHLNRLSFIRRSRDLGFTLDQVRDLLALADDRGGSCSAVDAMATGHVAQIDRKIADLRLLRDELVRLLEDCGQSTIGECRIIDALAPRALDRAE